MPKCSNGCGRDQIPLERKEVRSLVNDNIFQGIIKNMPSALELCDECFYKSMEDQLIKKHKEVQGPDLDVYNVGLFCASICTSLPLDEALRRINSAVPPGNWTLSEEANFQNGITNPCPCEEKPDTHKHYLLNC